MRPSAGSYPVATLYQVAFVSLNLSFADTPPSNIVVQTNVPPPALDRLPLMPTSLKVGVLAPHGPVQEVPSRACLVTAVSIGPCSRWLPHADAAKRNPAYRITALFMFSSPIKAHGESVIGQLDVHTRGGGDDSQEKCSAASRRTPLRAQRQCAARLFQSSRESESARRRPESRSLARNSSPARSCICSSMSTSAPATRGRRSGGVPPSLQRHSAKLVEHAGVVLQASSSSFRAISTDSSSFDTNSCAWRARYSRQTATSIPDLISSMTSARSFARGDLSFK